MESVVVHSNGNNNNSSGVVLADSGRRHVADTGGIWDLDDVATAAGVSKACVSRWTTGGYKRRGRGRVFPPPYDHPRLCAWHRETIVGWLRRMNLVEAWYQ